MPGNLYGWPTSWTFLMILYMHLGHGTGFTITNTSTTGRPMILLSGNADLIIKNHHHHHHHQSFTSTPFPYEVCSSGPVTHHLVGPRCYCAQCICVLSTCKHHHHHLLDNSTSRNSWTCLSGQNLRWAQTSPHFCMIGSQTSPLWFLAIIFSLTIFPSYTFCLSNLPKPHLGKRALAQQAL